MPPGKEKGRPFWIQKEKSYTNLVCKSAQLKMGRPGSSSKAKTVNEEVFLLANVLEKKGLVDHRQSSRLHWLNYLKPKVKGRKMTFAEEDLIIRLHSLLGNRWSLIAGRLPGRTENEIKNYWDTHLSMKVRAKGMDPPTHNPLAQNPNENSDFIGHNMIQPNDYVQLIDAPPYMIPNSMELPVSSESDLQSFHNIVYDFKNITAKIRDMELMDDQTQMTWTQNLECNPVELNSPIYTSIVEDEFQHEHDTFIRCIQYYHDN
ncbi:hypothetical protein SUGI_0489590 [Cryptomeria japonica]|uniref:transcription factor MYB1 isoform X2 n=1 Tax=Cryptomeria japonica TaxID=3369 RepID=UPI002408BCEC|nr:transcription factor MYB1 isoform X2 [Cryptomeria japonica]GLJ25566.1 hypothetical protein SUGI_0489590 [Cryptomeria japonica]